MILTTFAYFKIGYNSATELRVDTVANALCSQTLKKARTQ